MCERLSSSISLWCSRTLASMSWGVCRRTPRTPIASLLPNGEPARSACRCGVSLRAAAGLVKVKRIFGKLRTLRASFFQDTAQLAAQAIGAADRAYGLAAIDGLAHQIAFLREETSKPVPQ